MQQNAIEIQFFTQSEDENILLLVVVEVLFRSKQDQYSVERWRIWARRASPVYPVSSHRVGNTSPLQLRVGE